MLASRTEASSWLPLVEGLSPSDHRAVWDQVINAFTQLDHLSRDRAERPALEAYMRARLRPVFDRLGWNGSGSGDDDDTLLRASLIRALGEFGDLDVTDESRHRFAGFLKDPASLPPALLDPVSHVVGISANRESYDALLSLARKSIATNERVRYYNAAASARDGALARETLAITLGKELPSTMVNGVISQVASAGLQPQLAWDFIQNNLDALTARQGPDFGDQFVPNFMTNFHDEAHGEELRHFAPAQATSGGRVTTARALEAIAISADVTARVLPQVDRFVGGHPVRH
jgi:aminopeptidase N